MTQLRDYINKARRSQVWGSPQMNRVLNSHRTVTTACGCPSLIGPALGGGFGKYQGHFGLISDNIMALELVLANGIITTVSQDSYPDLFWGMRGGGDNLGIVTRMHQKVYEDPVATWFYAELQFTGNKLEAFTNVLNDFKVNGTQPKQIALIYSVMAINPAINETHPILISQFSFAGTEDDAQPYLKLLTALDPVTIRTNATLNPTQLSKVEGLDIDDWICSPGGSSRLNPVGIKSYNTTKNPLVYNVYKRLVTENSQFNRSVIQLKGYSMEGVRFVNANESAYAHRDDDILVYVSPKYSSYTAILTFYTAPSGQSTHPLPKTMK